MTFKPSEKPKHESADPAKCVAHGCPCRASISAGGGWICFAHYNQPADKWQRITQSLHSHDWLLGLVADVRKMSNAGQDWRAFASQFWVKAEPECMPQRFEESEPYCIRMLFECLHRVGAEKQKPEARNPAVLRERFFERRA